MAFFVYPAKSATNFHHSMGHRPQVGRPSGRQDSNLRPLVPQTSPYFPWRAEFDLECFRRERVGMTTRARVLESVGIASTLDDRCGSVIRFGPPRRLERKTGSPARVPLLSVGLTSRTALPQLREDSASDVRGSAASRGARVVNSGCKVKYRTSEIFGTEITGVVGSPSSERQRPRKASSIKPKIVCTRCNNGWMSSLQERAQPYWSAPQRAAATGCNALCDLLPGPAWTRTQAGSPVSPAGGPSGADLTP